MIEPSHVDVAGLMREAESRFILGINSVHGPRHWRAVLATAMALAEALGGDHALVAVFSLLHGLLPGKRMA